MPIEKLRVSEPEIYHPTNLTGLILVTFSTYADTTSDFPRNVHGELKAHLYSAMLSPSSVVP